MKQEEMNTRLYEKLAAEQTKYRDWLRRREQRPFRPGLTGAAFLPTPI